MPVNLAQTDEEIEACWPVVFQLRPHLRQNEFVATIRRQFAEGYQLAFIRNGGSVVAIAGFRLQNNLYCGRFCYVDDLVTSEDKRSMGFGAELLEWVRQYSIAHGCARLELDSGVQRFAAHRFYLSQRMYISCHHFSLDLPATPAVAK
jgi:GNAT superfamily N-acetyltransferase